MTTEDFKQELMELVHNHAGDGQLDNFAFLVDSMIASAKGDERTRVIQALTSRRSEVRVCRLAYAGEHEMMTPREIHELVAPRAV